MLNNEAYYKVLLPRWIWEEAKDKEHFKQLVLYAAVSTLYREKRKRWVCDLR
ncbi:hypothetical protein HNQ82_001220 [Anoxybacillus tengchongensis]|uniref:Uncharacterized protein n=1 Tax=Anoxybacillus tengchongensis TaxID=576944 RepID=A0A7X0DA41_9BACL|nr:hypothetical protein [Anoxybacillus tengchongensis]